MCEGYASLHGRRLNAGFCESDSDCKEITDYPPLKFSPSCIPYDSSKPTQKLCCFHKREKCTEGYQNLPIVKCSTTADCNSKNTTNWYNWCDATKGECCSEDGQNWTGPDGVTPFRNEPRCHSMIEGKILSGKCPNDSNAKCYRGHCRQADGDPFGKNKMGEFNYLTNFPCQPDELVPTPFTYSYCNGRTGTIMRLGSKAIKEVGLERHCVKDSNCSVDGSICIHTQSGKGACSRRLPISTTASPSRVTEVDPVDRKYSILWTVLVVWAIIFMFFGSIILCIIWYKKKSCSNTNGISPLKLDGILLDSMFPQFEHIAHQVNQHRQFAPPPSHSKLRCPARDSIESKILGYSMVMSSEMFESKLVTIFGEDPISFLLIASTVTRHIVVSDVFPKSFMIHNHCINLFKRSVSVNLEQFGTGIPFIYDLWSGCISWIGDLFPTLKKMLKIEFIKIFVWFPRAKYFIVAASTNQCMMIGESQSDELELEITLSKDNTGSSNVGEFCYEKGSTKEIAVRYRL